MSTWPQLPLGDLGEWYGGGTPSKSRPELWSGGIVPWLSPKDMSRDTLVDTQDHINTHAVEQSAVRLVPKTSVALVVRSGILERRVPVAVVPFETTLNQDMKAIVPRAGVDARWIAWGLRASERSILDNCRKAGTTVASLETTKLRQLRLPVPELKVQQQTLELLEDHLSRLDAATAGLAGCFRRVKGLIDGLLAAEMSAAADGKAAPLIDTNTVDDSGLPEIPASWSWRRLGDIADVVGGVTKDAKKQSDAAMKQVAYLRVANVQRGYLDLSNISKIRVPGERLAALRLLPGDVLLNEGGDRDKLGRGWIWEGQIDECIHQNHVFRARVQGHVILAQSVNLASISLRKIRLLPVPVPPRAEQEAIWQRITERQGAYKRLQDSVSIALKRSEAAKMAVLQAAFSERLTTRLTNILPTDGLSDV